MVYVMTSDKKKSSMVVSLKKGSRVHLDIVRFTFLYMHVWLALQGNQLSWRKVWLQKIIMNLTCTCNLLMSISKNHWQITSRITIKDNCWLEKSACVQIDLWVFNQRTTQKICDGILNFFNLSLIIMSMSNSYKIQTTI